MLSEDRELTEKEKKGHNNIERYKDGDNWKFTIGASTSLDEMKTLQKKLVSDFPQAFLVAFKDGKRINIQDAISEARKRK